MRSEARETLGQCAVVQRLAGVVWSRAGLWKETLPLTELSLLAEGTKKFSSVFCPSSYLAGQQEPCAHPTLSSAR